MQIDCDTPVEMDDGIVLRADVFRPATPGCYPVILTHGVYGKGLPIERARYRLQTFAASLAADGVLGADVADVMMSGSDAAIAADDYRVWEVVDPVEWVPRGYVCVRVDSRGSGRSPGRLDPLSPREIRDFAACIEWAGVQGWSNGRVGLCGKSYYAMSQWLVAALRPHHLAAICVWHGWTDWYRDATRHGGIMYQFWEKFWYPQLALPVQHGLGPQAGVNPHNGRPITGDEALEAATLAGNRADLVADIRAQPLDDDEYYRPRAPRLDQISVPVLATADWSDQELHLRGTIDGFLRAGSAEKWLEVHAGGHFDDEAALTLQRRFLDRFLKNADNDWPDQPRVQLAVRDLNGGATIAHAGGWPVPGTEWRSYHLDLAEGALSAAPPEAASQAAYDAYGPGVAVCTAPMSEEAIIVGPVAATLWVSSSTVDADLFLVLDVIDPEGQTVEFRDHRGGVTPASVGWLRASHRALDPTRSMPWQPYHPHRHSEPLEVGEVYEARVELRPTSLRLPAGHRLRLNVCGHGRAHDDPFDRPPEVFANMVTLHSGPATPAQLLLPVLSTNLA